MPRKKTTGASKSLLDLVLNGPPISDVTKDASQFVVALHARQPAVSARTQSSGEVRYPGYTRIRVDRSPERWSLHHGRMQLNADIVFPVCTEDPKHLTFVRYVSFGTEENQMLFWYALREHVRISRTVAVTLRGGLRFSLE